MSEIAALREAEELLAEVERRPRRFNPYSHYCSSVDPVIRKLPRAWELRRLKYLVSEPLKYGANEAAELDDPSLPRYIRITDVDDQGQLRPDTFRSIPEEIAAPYLLQEGDLLFARSGATVGKTFFYQNSWGRAAYAGYLIRARLAPHVCARFVHYFTTSHHYWQWLNSIFIQSTIQNVSAEKYANLLVTLPPLDEQRAIARFLDRETAKIDSLVAKKRRLIELLGEKRTALISRAVTKGLNPDAPTKPSGITCLGSVPTHWTVMAVKHALGIPITDGPHETPEKLTSGIPFISAESVKEDRLDFDKKWGYISEEEHARFSKKYCPKRGDVYMVKSGATTGNVARVTTDEVFNIWSPLAVLRPREDRSTTDFIFYFMKSRSFFSSVELAWSFGTQQNIGMGVVSNLRIALPPVSEQREITEYLSDESARIDSLVGDVRAAVTKLLEYRSSLISAAVTGQIDVRKEIA